MKIYFQIPLRNWYYTRSRFKEKYEKCIISTLDGFKYFPDYVSVSFHSYYMLSSPCKRISNPEVCTTTFYNVFDKYIEESRIVTSFSSRKRKKKKMDNDSPIS